MTGLYDGNRGYIGWCDRMGRESMARVAHDEAD
jgi:hypothetical protein